MKYFIVLFLIINVSFGQNIKEEVWNGIDVVWIEDNTLPLYHFYLYSDAGSFNEEKTQIGLTQYTLNMIDQGTSTLNHRQISDKFDFMGTGLSSYLTHEYFLLSFSGLIKDMQETTNLFCHLVQDSQFPKDRLDHLIKKSKKSLNNLVSNHSDLANRIFRRLTFKGTGYSYPTTGTLASLDQIRAYDTKEMWKKIKNESYKKIYIYGPSSLGQMKESLKNCGFKNKEKKARKMSFVSNGKSLKKSIYFASVPNASQAQVRWGRYLNSTELGQSEVLDTFSGNFFGGGFTSRLMQELRVKHGLTYGVFSIVSPQKHYGRSLIATSTKNESVVNLIKIIKNNVDNIKESIKSKEFLRSKNFIKGNYLLSQESQASYLQTLIQLDHRGLSYNVLKEFNHNVDKIKINELSDNIYNKFNMKTNYIFVLGDVSLKKKLMKYWNVIEISYADYL